MNRRGLLFGLLIMLGPGCGGLAPAIDQGKTAAPSAQVAPLQTVMATATSVPNVVTPPTAPQPASPSTAPAAYPTMTQQTTPLPTTVAPTSRVTPPSARPADRSVQVFFSRHPESDVDFTAVFPVNRVAPDAGVAAAALKALIAGPTSEEIRVGYFSEVGESLRGPSTCDGNDFTIQIADGLGTVRFCRMLTSAGIGQDARMQSALTSTLTQFSTIRQVRLLTHEGHCLFDLSGEDRCLAGARRTAG